MLVWLFFGCDRFCLVIVRGCIVLCFVFDYFAIDLLKIGCLHNCV